MRASALLPVSLLLAAQCVLASSGDRLPGFQHCVSHCSVTSCSGNSIFRPTLPMRLTRWTCEDDCKYTCMHALTDAAIANGASIHQFYGKWPFWRQLGMQEPASVLFSLLNLAAHVQGLRKVRRKVDTRAPMRPFLIGFAFVGINAWTWSAVFHTRDRPLTELLDYFSAGASIMYGFFLACVRVFGLYPTSSLSRARAGYVQHDNRTRLITPLALVCGALFVVHVLYLSFMPRFDYGYNMRASVAVGMLHNIVWLLYSAPVSSIRLFPAHGRGYRPKYARKPAIAVVLTMMAMSLELLDFPPWRRVLDAHALWHLATVPIVVYWYNFLIQDARDEGWGLDRERIVL